MSIASSTNLQTLFGKALKVPDYQRPYTWTEKQVKPLLEDLFAFFKKNEENKNEIPVLLGSTILFQNGNDFEIVDGQQRLTTLAIILYCLDKNEISFLNQNFTHQKSIDNIKVNQKKINEFIAKKEIDKVKWAEFILSRVHFIQIDAPTLDDAFVFFDSQNNRGKSLADYDVLKAHHLRYIADNQLATLCAKDWEKIDKNKDNTISLAYLLDTVLGRGRKWSRGNHSHLVLMDEFKSQRFQKVESGQYRINRYQQPPIFDSWSYAPEKGQDATFNFHQDFDATIGTKRLTLEADNTKFLPFQIAQTIEGGELFFWYTEKYYALYKELFIDENVNLSAFFKDLKQKVAHFKYNTGAKHLYDVWIASLVFYYDKFGNIEFDKVAIYLFYSLYYLRMKQASISEASVYKYIRETFNPFAIIHEASYHGFILKKIEDKMEGKMEEKDDKGPYSGIRKDFYTNFFDNQTNILKAIESQLSKLNQQ